MGWFYGFKLYIIINDKGELLDLVITQANVDDKTPLKEENFFKEDIRPICWQRLSLKKTCVPVVRPGPSPGDRDQEQLEKPNDDHEAQDIDKERLCDGNH